MDGTVRATCPGCRSPLRIPAQWVGQAVRCKKCGAVVRSKPKADAPTSHAPANVFSLDDEPQPVEAGNGAGFEDLVLPGRSRAPGMDDLFEDHPDPPHADGATESFPFPAPPPEGQPPVPPGYPYPLPP